MCLPPEEQNLCSRIVYDREKRNVAMPLLSPHEQIQIEQGLESGGKSFTTFMN
jgi:hypothetical protein